MANSNEYLKKREKKQKYYLFDKKPKKQNLEKLKEKSKKTYATLHLSKVKKNGKKEDYKQIKLFIDPYTQFKNETWRYNSSRFPMNSIQSGQFFTKIEEKFYNLLICDNDLVYIQGPIGDSNASRDYKRIYQELPKNKDDYSFIVRERVELGEEKYYPKNSTDQKRKAPTLMIKYRSLKKQLDRHSKREKEREKGIFTKRRVKDLFRRTKKTRVKEKNSSGNNLFN